LPCGPPGARVDRLRPPSMMSCYRHLPLCQSRHLEGSLVMHLGSISTAGSIYLTWKVGEEAFLLEKNVNVFL
uniref:Uncharacterized protein n=1 Tax=Colobus angolensis palliatus TaxID=336983 RepID=A0A2K5JKP2_COLAP